MPVTFSEVYNTPGTASWICPPRVYTVEVQCYGGGGKAGNRTTNSGSGGGGGGAYASGSVSVVPGTSYTYVVGAGSIVSDVSGGYSYFNTTSTVLAMGGASSANNSGVGAAGGHASQSVGTFRYSGGRGSNASSPTGVAFAGGGGEAASFGEFGVSSTGFAGGSGSAGGNGGNGKVSPQGNGSSGSAPGGGGGGALRTSSGTRLGGPGANGRVILTYTVTELPTVIIWGSD